MEDYHMRDNEFDRKMIEQISGMEYSEFEAKARTMLSQNSEYLQLMNGNWKVCHKEELLNQCKESKIQRKEKRRFRRLMLVPMK